MHDGIPSYEKFRLSLCSGLAFLSLKCKNDIRIISIVFTDPERQKRPTKGSAELLMQTNKWFTYRQKWPRLCLSLLFPFISWCQARLTFALWHLSSHVSQRQFSKTVRFVLDSIYDVLICSCVWGEQTDELRPLFGLGGGEKWKKDRHRRRSVWERCCPGDCVGLPGWQAVAAVFLSAGYGEEKMEVGRVPEKKNEA